MLIFKRVTHYIILYLSLCVGSDMVGKMNSWFIILLYFCYNFIIILAENQISARHVFTGPSNDLNIATRVKHSAVTELELHVQSSWVTCLVETSLCSQIISRLFWSQVYNLGEFMWTNPLLSLILLYTIYIIWTHFVTINNALGNTIHLIFWWDPCIHHTMHTINLSKQSNALSLSTSMHQQWKR